MNRYPHNYTFEVPERHKLRVIIDTDCANEADDQYALVHALLTPKFRIQGVIAAHFGTAKYEDSMQRSYDEIHKVIDLMDRTGTVPVFKGAEHALLDDETPVPSPGSELIIEEALKDDDRPLYILFWGPLTDMASALLKRPEIAGRVHVVWIGGHAFPQGGYEYNLKNDIRAANVVMRSNAPVKLITIPGFRHNYVGFAELQHRVSGNGKIGRYLYEQLLQFVNGCKNLADQYGEGWCLGDSPSIGVILNPHEYACEVHPAPLFSEDMDYLPSPGLRPIEIFQKIDARFLLEDFYSKLEINYPRGT